MDAGLMLYISGKGNFVFLTGSVVQQCSDHNHGPWDNALRSSLGLDALKSAIALRKYSGLQYSLIFDWLEHKLEAFICHKRLRRQLRYRTYFEMLRFREGMGMFEKLVNIQKTEASLRVFTETSSLTEQIRNVCLVLTEMDSFSRTNTRKRAWHKSRWKWSWFQV